MILLEDSETEVDTPNYTSSYLTTPGERGTETHPEYTRPLHDYVPKRRLCDEDGMNERSPSARGSAQPYSPRPAESCGGSGGTQMPF